MKGYQMCGRIKLNVTAEVTNGIVELRIADDGIEGAPWYQPGLGGDVLDSLGRAVTGEGGARVSFERASGHMAYITVLDPAIDTSWIRGRH